MGYEFHTTCVGVPPEKVPALNEMISKGKQITRRTFIKHVGRETLWEVERELGYNYYPACGLTMAGDWHVAYFKSTWEGHPCVYFVWSAIEHVFVDWRAR